MFEVKQDLIEQQSVPFREKDKSVPLHRLKLAKRKN